MPYANLPGIDVTKLDGNLQLPSQNDNPIVLVLGTSAQGDAEELFTVVRTTDAARVFGKDGTLVRGMYEAQSGQASNIRLFRIGAKPAQLQGLPTDVKIVTIEKDGDAGDNYLVSYTGTSGAMRLRVYRAADDVLVYDSGDGSDPDTIVDLGEVMVTGDLASGTMVGLSYASASFSSDATHFTINTTEPHGLTAGDAVTLSGFTPAGYNGHYVVSSVTDEDTFKIADTDNPGVVGAVQGLVITTQAVSLTDAPDHVSSLTFVAGDEGLEMSRMETYEALEDAYTLLEDAVVDLVVPMNVYLDDKNVTDLTTSQISALSLGALSDYPAAGAANDVLGKLYKEEYLGKMYYFWDMDGDGVAEIVPVVEGITSGQQTDLDGGDLSIAAAVAGDDPDLVAADFREVNFAYQLANFCYKVSHLNQEMTGMIGVRPPRTFGLKDVTDWVGSSPTYVVDGNGDLTISKNGTGLLGNKFMAGRKVDGTIPAHLIDGAAAPYGGFIATDDGEVDGVQLKDDNDHLVDLGKHLSVVSAWPLLVNPSRTAAYSGSGAALYAGMVSALAPHSAPTNKVVPSVSLPFAINHSKVDKLAGARYVHFFAKPKGTVVADAPTAARPDSDFQRLTTVRIVKAVIDTVRRVGEPFLGEGMSGAQLQALETGITNALQELTKAGILQRFDLSVDATTAERVQGKARVALVLVPVFELRQISTTVALAAA